MPSKAALRFIKNGRNPPPWLRAMYRKRREQQQRWRKDGVPFPVGQKNIYLPSFTIALLRTPGLSASWAQFEVPLSFNKLDLRDYLFYAYNVRIHSVRSFIVPSPVEFRHTYDPSYWFGRKMAHRKIPVKKMMVELEKPFVWPEEPTKEELEEKWDAKRYQEDRAQLTRTSLRPFKDRKLEEREKREQLEENMLELRETAERLLKGQQRWGTGSYPDIGSVGSPGRRGQTNLPMR